MERINLAQRAAVSQFYENGVYLSVSKIINKRPIAGHTADHESRHIIALGKIRRATIIPHGNALGSTEPVKMTAAGAAAPAAMGDDGFGWDKFVTENYLNVDWESAKAQGKAALKGKEEVRQEVAVLLQERKTIGQDDVNEAHENVQRRRNGIHSIEVNITSPQGKITTYKTESFHEQVLIPGKWISLPQAA